MVGLGSEPKTGILRRAFPTTLWTVVLRARDAASPERRRALSTLIHHYWRPLYHFARRRGYDVEKSSDLVQGFFTSVIERDAIRLVDRSLGRFRTFLLKAFRNFMADDHDRSSALKRGGRESVLSLDYASAETEVLEAVADSATPEQAYKREWALHLLSRALQTLELEYEHEGIPEEFETFRQHLSYGDNPRPSYQDMARALGVSESVVRNRLHSARKRYARAILQHIRSYTETEEEAREEIADLFNAFS